MPQSTLNGLINQPYNWSPHLVRLARELQTTVAYLTCETDDPHGDSPADAPLDVEERELVDKFAELAPADRRALLQIARSMTTSTAKPTDTVHTPPLTYVAKEGGR